MVVGSEGSKAATLIRLVHHIQTSCKLSLKPGLLSVCMVIGIIMTMGSDGHYCENASENHRRVTFNSMAQLFGEPSERYCLALRAGLSTAIVATDGFYGP